MTTRDGDDVPVTLQDGFVVIDSKEPEKAMRWVIVPLPRVNPHKFKETGDKLYYGDLVTIRCAEGPNQYLGVNDNFEIIPVRDELKKSTFQIMRPR